MAKIVFAAGTSHTPMLLASDETLPRFQETDRNIKHRDKDGRSVTYGDLYILKQWKLTHTPAILIGMDTLGLLDTLVIDYKRHELQMRMVHSG